MIHVTEPNTEAIDILQALLKKAQDGEIKELMVVAIVDDENHIIAHTEALDYHERLGILEHMKMVHFRSIEIDFESD